MFKTGPKCIAALGGCWLLLGSLWISAGAQDILRQRLPASLAGGAARDQHQHPNQHPNQNHNQQHPSQSQNSNQIRQAAGASGSSGNNPLANIQLPPQLASLTPQQLRQLAQLRELQLQQAASEAAQQAAADQQPSAPAPIGLETATPTAQLAPAAASAASPQDQQPSGASAASASENNDRHDDGSYNEAGSEQEGVSPADGGPPSAGAASSAAGATSGGQSGANAAAAPTFEVNWNKCPQLEPSESEKGKKTQVITKCLQSAPIPANLTRENVEAHREQIATCALRDEGWFDEAGQYKYEKAEAEIRGKRLEPAIELQVLKFHVACKEEASKKFPRNENKLIDQVQFYQACMDYYISIVCEIEVSVDQ